MAETTAEYNAKVIAEFRANSGRVGDMWEDIPLLLLHHTGAKSGMSRVNPVAYLPDDAGYLIWAANGGAPKNPAWYQNLMTYPITRIELGRETVSYTHLDVYKRQVKGCVEAAANFDQFGLPDAYETIVGCPTVVDAEQLWAHIGFSHMTRGGWAAAGGFGQYGNQSKSYVLNYQSSDFEPCWAFATISRVNNVIAVTGFCDYQDNGLPADAQEAQAWAAIAVSRIQVLDKHGGYEVG